MAGFVDKDIFTVGTEVASEAFTLVRNGMTEAEAVNVIANERAYAEPEIIDVMKMPEFIQGIAQGFRTSRHVLERK